MIRLVLLVFPASFGFAAVEDVVVRGRVVDEAGRPAADVVIANFWHSTRVGMTPYRSAKTNAEGRYEIAVPSRLEETVLLAFNQDRSRGGMVTVRPKEKAEAGECRLVPTVAVSGKFFCKELDRKPKWTNAYLHLGKSRPLMSDSDDAEFIFQLPPGDYKFDGYGSDVLGVKRDLKIEANKPTLDVGVIDLPASPIAKHVGKASPPWRIKEARGLPKSVSIADLKGKWVLVDFWGHWCGPCVAKMPELIDFYELHAEHRDKFEIVAFHDSSVDSLAAMDEKLVKTKVKHWSGRSLPFPVLLDDAKATATAYGISSWPTSLLIDPEGKLVGEAEVEALEAKLPKAPFGARAKKALDRSISIGMPDGLTLVGVVNFIGGRTKIPLKLDESALKAAGVDPTRVVPLSMSASVSTRSWLNLLLAPDGLTYRIDADHLFITVGKRPPDSEAQKVCSERLNKLLDRPFDLDGKERTLSQFTQYLEDLTDENFVLDPASRRSGRLKPGAKAACVGKSEPLRVSLKRTLEPLKLAIAVRDEVVVIESVSSQ